MRYATFKAFLVASTALSRIEFPGKPKTMNYHGENPADFVQRRR